MKKAALFVLLFLFGCTMSTSVTTCVPDSPPPKIEIKGIELLFHNTDWRKRTLWASMELLNPPFFIGEMKLAPDEKWMFCIKRKSGEKYRIMWKTLGGDVVTKQEFEVGPPTKKVYSKPFTLHLEFD